VPSRLVAPAGLFPTREERELERELALIGQGGGAEVPTRPERDLRR
jgi:hypothetical protein